MPTRGIESLFFILICIVVMPVGSQALASIVAEPVYTGGHSATLVGEGLDLDYRGTKDSHFSLSAAEAGSDGLWGGVAVFDVPELDLGIPIDAFSVPIFAGGLSFDVGSCTASLGTAGIFPPSLSSNVSSIDISLASDPAFCFEGSVAYDGVSLALLWGEGAGAIEIGDGAKVGELGCSLGLAALRYKSWGALCGYASGEASLSINTWIFKFLPIPWAEADGSFDLRFAAVWGSIPFGGPCFGGSIDLGTGLVWNNGVFFDSTAGVGWKTTSSLAWSLASHTSGIAVLHPNLYWRPSPYLAFGLGRWLPYTWGWTFQNGTSEIASAAPSSWSSLSLATILFSGLEVTGKYEF